MIPLSFAQSRLWFLYRFEGGVATYNMPTAFRINGALDVEALDAAIDDVIARHESLRTIFVDIYGVPYQEVLPAAPGMWRRGGDAVAVAGRTPHGGRNWWCWPNTSLICRPNILDPCSRSIRVAPEEYFVGIVVHHIAFDGWSLAPMV